MRYGVPYQGSKNSIAQWVVGNLPPAGVFIDLFAGGCAVTHAAMLSGKFAKYIVNDLGDAPDVFIKAANGGYADYDVVPTREEFNNTTDYVTKLLYSFGNNCSDYLWGAQLERVKVAASRMLIAPTLHERRMRYRDFIKCLEGVQVTKGLCNLQGLERLQGLEGLEGLERLERLCGLRGMDRLERLRVDYRDVDLPEDATIYADPPYRGADCGGYAGGVFDYHAFDAWLAECGRLVIVSEYTCPAGCVEIASRPKRVLMDSNDNRSVKNEGLYVHESQLENYLILMSDSSKSAWQGTLDC